MPTYLPGTPSAQLVSLEDAWNKARENAQNYYQE